MPRTHITKMAATTRVTMATMMTIMTTSTMTRALEDSNTTKANAHAVAVTTLKKTLRHLATSP